MNAQDPFQIDGRIVFLSGPGGYLGRQVAIATDKAAVTHIPVGRNSGRFGHGTAIGKPCVGLCHGRGVDGGRQMDGLVG